MKNKSKSACAVPEGLLHTLYFLLAWCASSAHGVTAAGVLGRNQLPSGGVKLAVYFFSLFVFLWTVPLGRIPFEQPVC